MAIIAIHPVARGPFFAKVPLPQWREMAATLHQRAGGDSAEFKTQVPPTYASALYFAATRGGRVNHCRGNTALSVCGGTSLYNRRRRNWPTDALVAMREDRAIPSHIDSERAVFRLKNSPAFVTTARGGRGIW